MSSETGKPGRKPRGLTRLRDLFDHIPDDSGVENRPLEEDDGGRGRREMTSRQRTEHYRTLAKMKRINENRQR